MHGDVEAAFLSNCLATSPSMNLKYGQDEADGPIELDRPTRDRGKLALRSIARN